MAKGEESSSSSIPQSKKKRSEDEPMLEDVSAKPLQLQRRRVWRACESCRYAIHVRASYHRRPPALNLLSIFLPQQAQEDQV